MPEMWQEVAAALATRLGRAEAAAVTGVLRPVVAGFEDSADCEPPAVRERLRETLNQVRICLGASSLDRSLGGAPLDLSTGEAAALLAALATAVALFPRLWALPGADA